MNEASEILSSSNEATHEICEAVATDADVGIIIIITIYFENIGFLPR